MRLEERPWGHYEILLDSPECKVKRITVNPDSRLSYQYHKHRAETWVILAGVGIITIDGIDLVIDRSTLSLTAAIEIPIGAPHRISNIGKTPLIFIEVQRGESFDEDDIVRLEDDYGRA